MLTGPVAAARAAVATGAWVKSKHMYLIRGSVGALPIRRGIKKEKEKESTRKPTKPPGTPGSLPIIGKLALCVRHTIIVSR